MRHNKKFDWKTIQRIIRQWQPNIERNLFPWWGTCRTNTFMQIFLTWNPHMHRQSDQCAAWTNQRTWALLVIWNSYLEQPFLYASNEKCFLEYDVVSTDQTESYVDIPCQQFPNILEYGMDDFCVLESQDSVLECCYHLICKISCTNCGSLCDYNCDFSVTSVSLYKYSTREINLSVYILTWKPTCMLFGVNVSLLVYKCHEIVIYYILWYVKVEKKNILNCNSCFWGVPLILNLHWEIGIIHFYESSIWLSTRSVYFCYKLYIGNVNEYSGKELGIVKKTVM